WRMDSGQPVTDTVVKRQWLDGNWGSRRSAAGNRRTRITPVGVHP
ncbi:hypothetical protein A2U01_0067546, partial [Trifolium medium]|nr:hypothetical protein [Trifolium medium]